MQSYCENGTDALFMSHGVINLNTSEHGTPANDISAQADGHRPSNSLYAMTAAAAWPLNESEDSVANLC